MIEYQDHRNDDTRVERMSLRDVRAWLTAYERAYERDETYPCEHGHFDCSTEERGPCMDEALHALGESENAE